MKISGNTILITGGATGIGFALAKKLVEMKNDVVICGRRESKLREAKEKLPQLHTIRCDISKEDDRKMLYDRIEAEFDRINVLVNNAGIQRRIDFRKGADDVLKSEDEIEINFRSQIRLTAQFIPLLLGKENSAIVNVSSGLGFVPLAIFPVYCATKAAMHSFTMSLREQLKETKVRVFEVIPPTVYDTELKGKPIEKTDWASSSTEVAEDVIKGLEADQYEISTGAAKAWVSASRQELDDAFKRINH